jgi:putative restriction endonuclease
MTSARIPEGLPERHRSALEWFDANRGSVMGWPSPLTDGTLVACRPKGIYKPRWSDYALSIRETMIRPYPDEQPAFSGDGSWTYRYFQENPDPSERDREFTNRALLRNIADNVPVGVMRQVARRPSSQYEILGIAHVRKWDSGFFVLEGAAT